MFIPVILGAGVFTHSHPPCLPRLLRREASLGIASLRSSQTSLLAGLLPRLLWGRPPLTHHGELRQPLAPHQMPRLPPSSPGWAGSQGGAAIVLPWCFPWLPTGGLAAEGGCWGLQQAGGGSGQACAHAAGTTARPVTQGHLSRSCRTPTSAAAHIPGGYRGCMLDAGCQRSRCRDTEGMLRECRGSQSPAPAVCTFAQGHQLCNES